MLDIYFGLWYFNQMIIGTVNLNYVIFYFGDSSEISEQIDMICDSLWIESRLKAQGYSIDEEEEQWR